jgi:5'-nucleotidase
VRESCLEGHIRRSLRLHGAVLQSPDPMQPISSTRIVITNDDGVDAPGIEALVRAARGLGDLVVVAPDLPRSGVGHSVITHVPIPVARLGERRFSVGGMPADCTRIALASIAPGAAWVLSGINRGANLGADVYISGTVAAAREAAFLGVRAMALSQYDGPSRSIDWGWTEAQCARVIRLLVDRPLRPRSFWNVNLPEPRPGSPDPPVVFAALDLSPLDVRFRLEGDFNGTPTLAHWAGNYHARRREPGLDIDACFGGAISVTEVSL